MGLPADHQMVAENEDAVPRDLPQDVFLGEQLAVAHKVAGVDGAIPLALGDAEEVLPFLAEAQSMQVKESLRALWLLATSPLLAALLLTALGVIAGLAPASRAMAIKPVDAMRDE